MGSKVMCGKVTYGKVMCGEVICGRVTCGQVICGKVMCGQVMNGKVMNVSHGRVVKFFFVTFVSSNASLSAIRLIERMLRSLQSWITACQKE